MAGSDCGKAGELNASLARRSPINPEYFAGYL